MDRGFSKMVCCLVDLPILTRGKISRFIVEGRDSICQKFEDMGIRKNSSVKIMNHLPLSQNIHVIVGNESFILRSEEARLLEVFV